MIVEHGFQHVDSIVFWRPVDGTPQGRRIPDKLWHLAWTRQEMLLGFDLNIDMALRDENLDKFVYRARTPGSHIEYTAWFEVVACFYHPGVGTDHVPDIQEIPRGLEIADFQDGGLQPGLDPCD